MDPRHITVERTEDLERAFARLREAPFDNPTGDEMIAPYSDATFTLRSVDLDMVSPTSFYALRGHLAFQRALRARLLTQGIDTLFLREILHLRYPDGTIVGMGPPVVEIYQDQFYLSCMRGEQGYINPITMDVRILLDGIHRALLARKAGLRHMNCIVIQGSYNKILPYAHPNSWEQVHVLEEVPPHKKNYRRTTPYTDMRPLSRLYQIPGKNPTNQWNSRS